MDSRGRDRREYFKEWRKLNKDKVEKYERERQVDYAKHSADYRMNHPEMVLWSLAKRRAKDKNIEFNLDPKKIDMPIICPILGIPIVKTYTKGEKKGPTPNSPSLDRIDNTKGYVDGNVQVISHKANTMKHTATPQELIRFANWIFINYKEEV